MNPAIPGSWGCSLRAVRRDGEPQICFLLLLPGTIVQSQLGYEKQSIRTGIMLADEIHLKLWGRKSGGRAPGEGWRRTWSRARASCVFEDNTVILCLSQA